MKRCATLQPLKAYSYLAPTLEYFKYTLMTAYLSVFAYAKHRSVDRRAKIGVASVAF